MLLYAFLGNITYLTEHGSINIESFIKDLGKKFHIKKIAHDQAVRNGGSTGSVYDERGILSF